jgi:hypothetical protein
LGVETRDLGDKVVRRSVDRYLRIPVVAVGSSNVFIKGNRTPEELFCLFETACDAGVGRKVKFNHGIVVVL